MNKAIRALLETMLSHRKIGASHTPEHRIIVSKTKRLDKDEKKQFGEAYKSLKNQGIILFAKKRTGKGFDWHISLNPSNVNYVNEMLEEDER